MPSSDILIRSPIKATFRTAQVAGMFDVPDKESVEFSMAVKMPIEDRPWRIGLVVGPSGSGKTTIGRQLFPEAKFHTGYKWPKEGAIVDGFPAGLDSQVITGALSAVGFSSPPHWLKRFSHLSNGQQFRCELARVMLEDAETVIVDEFTSVVDRDAAKISSAAVAKAIRNRDGCRLIALSCHYDVIDWLDPDWIFNTATGDFAWRELRRRPPIELRIHKATGAAWGLFRGHHYLTANLPRPAQCFVAAWHGTPVAFTSYLHLWQGKIRNGKRECRTVVLPDFQGVGIGNAVSEWLGRYVLAKGFRFYSTTSHPAMIRHRHRSRLWKLNRMGHTPVAGVNERRKNHGTASASRSHSRVTAGFEFVGEPRTSSVAVSEIDRREASPQTPPVGHGSETAQQVSPRPVPRQSQTPSRGNGRRARPRKGSKAGSQ